MRSYLSLIPISAKVHKRRSRMILICIILAVFLVTGVFSMADMGIRMEKIRAYQNHGNWHIMLHDLPKEQAEAIGAQKNVAAASWYDVVNYKIDKDYYIQGKKTAVCGIQEDFLKMFAGFSENTYPKNSNEAILSANIQNLMDIGVGDTVTVNTPAGDLELTVSGFTTDTANLMQYDSLGVLVNMEAFEQLLHWNGEESQPVYYIQFGSHVNARQAIDDIKTQYGLTDNQVGENTLVLGLSGMSRNSLMLSFYGIAAILFVLILAAGVLMIAGSINTSVAERTQFFGMLRCIGASRKQVIRFVRMEALNWCRLAIPAGVTTGVAATWGLCSILHYVVGGEFEMIPVFGVSLPGILSGILVGLLTVLLAAQAPAKRAARISPMAAVSGNTGNVKTLRRGTSLRLGRVETALGIHHAVSAKKNLLLMTLSFALSIILFLGFSATLDFVRAAFPSLRASSPDASILSADRSCTVGRDLVPEIEAMPGVKTVFGRMYQTLPTISEKGVEEIDLISYEANQFRWSQGDLLSGDLDKALGDSNYVVTDFDPRNPLTVGDKLQINGLELEVAAVLSSTPFNSDETPTVICSEETFTRLTGHRDYAVIDVQFLRNVTREDIEAVRARAGDDYLFSDRWELNQENIRVYWAFRLVVYGFLAIIAMIAVFNILNSIAMSVSARIRQYGAMRAVGMSAHQVVNMIAAEAGTYSLFGTILGCAVGIPLNRLSFTSLVTAHFGTQWQLPLGLIGVTVLLVVLATAAAVHGPAKRIRNMAITATINEL